MGAGTTVFISYRRSTSWQLARLVLADLRQHGYDVFMDVVSLDAGRFDDVVLREVGRRDHVVVVLEPETRFDPDAADDWMRREVAHALDRGRSIVPVVARGYRFETATLPTDIAALADFTAVAVHDDYVDEALERLRTRFLRAPLPAPEPTGSRSEPDGGTYGGTPVLPVYVALDLSGPPPTATAMDRLIPTLVEGLASNAILDGNILLSVVTFGRSGARRVFGPRPPLSADLVLPGLSPEPGRPSWGSVFDLLRRCVLEDLLDLRRQRWRPVRAAVLIVSTEMPADPVPVWNAAYADLVGRSSAPTTWHPFVAAFAVDESTKSLLTTLGCRILSPGDTDGWARFVVSVAELSTDAPISATGAELSSELSRMDEFVYHEDDFI